MSYVILICGKLAAGKSTYAEKLRKIHHAALLSCDRLMLSLFDPYLGDRHDEIAERTRRYLLEKSLELLEVGIPVILDWGFWTKHSRNEIKFFYNSRGIKTEMHYVTLSDTAWQRNLQSRSRLDAKNMPIAYPIDEKLIAKCLSRFEEPTDDEIDITYNNSQESL